MHGVLLSAYGVGFVGYRHRDLGIVVVLSLDWSMGVENPGVGESLVDGNLPSGEARMSSEARVLFPSSRTKCTKIGVSNSGL